ncbi:DivIVA domain-containing protein [Gordonia sp. PDNC005]|uniref:DivIVA domain-containing protein n=1 Tax=unclassified Gordonia (in: high G+C Gram-positive bacteria) TaxID=2657482 RepID=UPI001964F8D8|nr:DivIVA domain-containing protein [Gordonia sp. PDNC005]QRY62027.1 DivIVA domain-containing protein [Gordonia sp. PDNC005]
MLTPENIRLVRFQPTRRFEKGYREEDVDQFLRVVEDDFRELQRRVDGGTEVVKSPSQSAATPRPERTLLPEEIRDVAFSKPPIGLRGYNEDEVDQFLDEVEATVRILRDRLSKYEAL